MKNHSRLAGILGAVIIHLIAAIIFMLVKLGSLNVKEIKREYELTLEAPPMLQPTGQKKVPAAYSVEQILRGDEDLLNIARNLASKPDINIDREDYIDMVKDELINAGKLGKDNYIDEQKQQKNTGNKSSLSLAVKQEKEEDKPDNSMEMAARYSGPTRIYYNLPGRTHTYLPLPIYKCEGAGKVALNIEVNPKGEVLSAAVIESESTTGDPCLVETAKSAAIRSRFNADIDAVKIQSGTLTYHFVAQ
jgi:hypothetical protein